MIRNQDIVYIGVQPWENDIATNGKNYSLEFARHNRVLYVNYAIDRISLVKNKNNPLCQKHFDIVKNKKENLFQVEENIWVLYPTTILESANWIPSTAMFRRINQVNNRRFAKDIQRGIDRLGFKNFILFNDSDMFRGYHLKELLKPALNMYYTRDNLMGVSYWYKHGRFMEPEIFAKSDLVVANSTYLADVARKYNKNTFYVGQGCDINGFDPGKVTEVPADIAHIKSPVIGYTGTLFNLRLDVHLLEEMAVKRPEWNFVLIGPEDDVFKNSLLHNCRNVHFLGLRDVSQLPAYMARFDVALNPQRINVVTIGNYPRKIDEYLAMGRPIVATETGAMSIFKDHVYFASTTEEYIQQIERALAENSYGKEQERIAFAHTHTWENSVAEVYKAMITVSPELEEGVLESA
jgi:glycosyltransferase involved in cell wall biosynthesis